MYKKFVIVFLIGISFLMLISTVPSNASTDYLHWNSKSGTYSSTGGSLTYSFTWSWNSSNEMSGYTKSVSDTVASGWYLWSGPSANVADHTTYYTATFQVTFNGGLHYQLYSTLTVTITADCCGRSSISETTT